QALDKLIELASTPENADDRLAAGTVALASKDATAAERHFEEAQSLGAEIGPYLAPLAATALSQARQLVETEEFSDAEAVLANLEAKYADTAWFASNRAAFEAVRAKAKGGVYEVEAEKLYKEAAELFQTEQLFDVKPLVEMLKGDYADSQAVTDAAREPSFAEMEEAAADLGQFLSVRLDGTADFTSVQQAIDAAPPNSLIEIQDNGPYNEKISIQQEGLTVRGKTGCWPTITSVGRVTNFPVLVQVFAPRISMERVVLSHAGAAGVHTHCVGGSLTIRSSIVDCGRSTYPFRERPKTAEHSSIEIEECVVIGRGPIYVELNVRNSVWLGAVGSTYRQKLENVLVRGAWTAAAGTMRFCTIGGRVGFADAANRLTDSIVLSVQSADAGTAIEYCDVYGNPPFIDQAKPGKGCFGLDPQFRDPANLDYRLMPTSPCIGKASDGGDIGCRYTPEMIEMCEKALELRAQGIIKF
ncbi:MAG: hypothetical protein HQ582_05005, partial [Planctomycetes bacterium]|nr:hypothetical protein [Planctomycetota bacterium]